MVCNVQLAGGVTNSRGGSKNNGSTACDRCNALEANDHEKIKCFVSLLDQQDEMWAKGKSAEAKELEGAISSARRATVQARSHLAMHRTSHRENSYTSSTDCSETNRQRGMLSIYG